MDKFETGAFEISTSVHNFYKDWQLELLKSDLERRARTAMQELQRPGTPYVTCLYPTERRGDKLVLVGWIALALWRDCRVGECVFCDDDLTDFNYIARAYGVVFEYQASTFQRSDDDGVFTKIYIYKRIA